MNEFKKENQSILPNITLKMILPYAIIAVVYLAYHLV